MHILESPMNTMKKVAPAQPVAPWLGGKKRLYKTLIERIEAIPHKTYVEPFVGMGGVFLRRRYQPACEVANDLNSEVINLFRVLQRFYPQLMDHMKYQITSRREFERLRKKDPATLLDIERAARFLYLQRIAFGGQHDGVFGVSPGRPGRFSIDKLGPLLDAAWARLQGVVFESLDWSELVRRYDTKSTLFYLDPPYFGGEDDYGKGMFNRSHYAAMADQLATIDGEFIMSINDTPEIREWFAAFHVDEVRLNYSVARSKGKKVQELIISSVEPRTGLL